MEIVLVSVTIDMIKYPGPKPPGKKRIYFVYTSTALFITKESQGRVLKGQEFRGGR